MPKPRRIRRMGQIALSLACVLALLPLARPLVMRILASDETVALALRVVYDVPVGNTEARPTGARYRIDLARVINRVDERFLSVAVDTSQLAGGHWWSRDGRVEWPVGTHRVSPFDFDRPRLRRLARALAPAYLRVGGTEADSIHYAVDGQASAGAPPPGYDLSLTRERWDALHGFTRDTGLSLMFTVNAGPGPRDAGGRWQPGNLTALLRYSAARGYAVPVWELGNEINAFLLTHGLDAHVGGRRYAQDVETFTDAVRAYFPDSKVAAAAAFVWPVMGEAPPRIMESYLRHSQTAPDVLTWHYYPQQSRRCWSATRRASPTRLLEPDYLDEFGDHGTRVHRLADSRSNAIEVWLGETGGAQCGGEPGVSDRFASSLWWLDQLGLAARGGQRVVVRQTLTGGDYGLLDPDTLAPRPDYWASLLWKRLMGSEVVAVTAEADNPHLRVYAHCHPAHDGRVSVLSINLSQAHPLQLSLPGQPLAGADLYRVDAERLDASTVALNGEPLRLGPDANIPALDPTVMQADALTVAPTSLAFTVLNANAPACL